MRQPTVLFVLLASLALVAAPVAAAKPSLEESNDKIVLSNDHVVVWFQGKKPFLKLFEAGNETPAYELRFLELAEYRDVDANGAIGAGEAVATLDLFRADAWEVETSDDEDGAVVLNLSLEAPVKLAGGGPNDILGNVTLPERDVKINLVFTLRSADASINATDNVSVAVPATAIKYDLIVESWPAADPATSRLALVFDVTGQTSKTLGVGIEGATVAMGEDDVGVLSWTTVATGTTAQGAPAVVPVKSSFEPRESEGENESENATTTTRTRVTLTYDAANLATLRHDPTIGIASAGAPIAEEAGGVAETIKDVPGAGLAVLAVGVAIAALAARRRSR